MIKNRALTAAMSALILAALGCSSEVSATAQNPSTREVVTREAPTSDPSGGNAGGITITRVTMYVDNGHGEPGDEVTVFKPTDHIMHFLAEADGLDRDRTVKLVFTGVDTAIGKDIPVTEAETHKLEVANQITGKVSLNDDWPVGSYRLDIYVDGVLIYTWDYAVEE